MQFTSELAARALNLLPIGVPWAGAPCSCAMCRRPIARGDLAERAKFQASFTSYWALTPSEAVCGWCSATRKDAPLRALQRVVIREDGLYPIGTDDARAWLFLTPPEPPFAIVVNQASATSALHLFWRTPVTTDRDLLVARVNDNLMHIRRPVLLEAIGWCASVADALRELPDAKKRTEGPLAKHPFVRLDRSLTHPAHGRLLPACERLEGQPRQLARQLSALLPGELWALATLVKANPPTPTAPAPIRTLKESQS